MHRYNIEITDLAEQDLENAADYIAFHLKNPSAAVNTVKGIRILHMLVDSRTWLYRTLGLSDHI